MHRFFIKKQDIESDSVTIEGNIARQISKVLRLVKGDYITVMDGINWEYRIILDEIDSRRILGTIMEKSRCQGEPKYPITLYQGILKSHKFEMVLQKGTELGITTFVPVICERTIPRGDVLSFDRKLDRYMTIVREAAEQSHRGVIPVIGKTLPLAEAFRISDGSRIILWEKEKAVGISDQLNDKAPYTSQGISLFVGPEGGFTNREIRCSVNYGLIPVTLGKRILRAETASLAAIVVVLSSLGEFKGQ